MNFVVRTIMLLSFVGCCRLGQALVVSNARSSAHRMILNRMVSLKGGSSIPDTNEGKVVYTLGVNIAKQVGSELKGLLSPDEIEIVVQGFSDSILNKIADEKALLTQYGPSLNELLSSRSGLAGDNEKKSGQQFIDEYLLSNPKAVRTESGLVVNEMIAGIGKQATIDSTVLVHYHGTLIDGTVFDSSVDRNDPIKFPLRNVIRGWQEGVALMKVGGKATLVVPSDLAYGDSGSPPVIAPGATLVFEVQLLDVL